MTFVVCMSLALLFGACSPTLSPQQTEESTPTFVPTSVPETSPTETPTQTVQIPDFSVDEVQPLIYAAGLVVGFAFAAEFDAARGIDVDRYFADAFLYEFLNYELYDAQIQPDFDEETYMSAITPAEMFYLLRQYIGDYPELIDPPAETFLTLNEAGDYTYAVSDQGDTDFEMSALSASYVGEGQFEVAAALYRIVLTQGDRQAGEHIDDYTLRFLQSEDSAYGYTLIGCVKTA
ncbi:MAG: hypothetical protein FWG47_01760 [Propionibacteriaceae bacterium]|nr:hypothetical protein [Propionibacteriaceae bacterium]